MSANPVLFETYTDGCIADGNFVVRTQTDITLRDLFAAFAMAGLLAYADDQAFSSISDYAYRHADAMLAEREKGGAS